MNTISPVSTLSEDKLTSQYGVVKLLIQNTDGKFNPNSNPSTSPDPVDPPVTTPPKYITKIDNTDKYQFLVDFALSVIETCP